MLACIMSRTENTEMKRKIPFRLEHKREEILREIERLAHCLKGV